MTKSVLLLTCILFFVSINSAVARQMGEMQGMDMQSHTKNVYLSMMDTMMSAMGNARGGKCPSAIFMQVMIPLAILRKL